MVSVSPSRLHELEACALRADLNTRNIRLLQERIKNLESALEHEHTRSATQVLAFASGTLTFENLARDLEAQYADKLTELESAHDAALTAKDAAITAVELRIAELEASHARTIAAKDAALGNLEHEHAALRADAAAQFTAIHAAVTSELALEIHPVRTDGLQFATLHVGPLPVDTFAFDTAWCASAGGDKWKVATFLVT
jgi:hypothetical protein